MEMDNPLRDLILPDPKEIPEPTRYTLGLVLQYHEQTRRIVEEVIEDLRDIRNNSENIAVLDNRIAALENKLGEFNTHCKECSKRMVDAISKDSDKCNFLEKSALKEHSKMRKDLSDEISDEIEKLETKFSTFKEGITTQLHNLDKQMAITTVKITAIVAVILWVLKFVGTVVFNQLVKGSN